MKLKKLSIAFGWLLTVSAFSKDIEIDSKISKFEMALMGLDQGGKIAVMSDIVIPAGVKEVSYHYSDRDRSDYYSCDLRVTQSDKKLRIITKGTVLNIAEVVDRSPINDDSTEFLLKFSPEDNLKGIASLGCRYYYITGDTFKKVFNGDLQITVPQPMAIDSAIKIPKSKTAPKITANEVVQILPKACVYIGLWKENQHGQLPKAFSKC